MAEGSGGLWLPDDRSKWLPQSEGRNIPFEKVKAIDLLLTDMNPETKVTVLCHILFTLIHRQPAGLKQRLVVGVLENLMRSFGLTFKVDGKTLTLPPRI